MTTYNNKYFSSRKQELKSQKNGFESRKQEILTNMNDVLENHFAGVAKDDKYRVSFVNQMMSDVKWIDNKILKIVEELRTL